MKNQNETRPHLDIEVGDLVRVVSGIKKGLVGIVVGMRYPEQQLKHDSTWIPSLIYTLQDPAGSCKTTLNLGHTLALIRDADIDPTKYKWE